MREPDATPHPIVSDLTSPIASPGRIDAVLFDVDGLMVDTEPLQTLAWDIYLRPFGRTIGPEEKALLLGRRPIESAAVMRERFALPDEPESIMAGRKPILFSLVRENLRPMPGLFEVVATCDALGVKTAIASSSYSDYIDLVLDHIGLKSRFRVIVTGDQVSNGKPNPEVFLKAAAALGVAPPRCLVLEDSPNGVKAAKRAGMLCAAINACPESPADLALADVVYCDLTQVIPDIHRWVSSEDTDGGCR